MLINLAAFDGILHMSEFICIRASGQLHGTDYLNEGGEVENPRKRVPRAMTWSYGVGWLFLVTFMFTFNFHIGDPEVIGTAPPGWV